MSSNKRRKIEASVGKIPLSAFAARRALKTRSPPRRPNLTSQNDEENSLTEEGNTKSLTGLPLEGFEIQAIADEVSDDEPDVVGSELELNQETEVCQLSPFEKHGDYPDLSTQRPSAAFSTWKPSNDTFKELPKGTINIRVAPGERLVVLGQYDLSVQTGSITLLGAVLKPSSKLHRVFAPSTQSLPIIRCLATDFDHAEIQLHQCHAGLGSLKSLSPLFGRLWNDQSGPLGAEYQRRFKKAVPSTFQVLFPPKEGDQNSCLQPLISPPEWNALLSKIIEPTSGNRRVVMICGPKSSGKSTFAKLLVNRLITASRQTSSPQEGKKGAKSPSVAVLDLDPGQPEYSPPGQLSLIHIVEPNFGPPFSHPVPNPPNKLICSHAIGAISPSLEPSHYMSCALNLFGHYRNLLLTHPDTPLILNTPGWILGTGLELLVELIEKVHPTEIIYMSLDGPPEVTSSLSEAAKSTPLLTLPSQVSEYTTRTAAQLRTMQYMSYFHLSLSQKDNLAWSATPLSSIPPWEVCYAGRTPAILGVMCFGEQPPAALLSDTINGSLVSVVVIDDMSAIPGWTDLDGEDQNMEIPFDPSKIQRPLIIQTPEGIPYFNPLNTLVLSPSSSHSLGLALVRGIDTQRQRIQILTSIPPDTIEQICKEEKKVILVSGKLDTPGWAYTEALIRKSTLEKDGGEVDDEEMMKDDETGEEGKQGSRFESVPWVERLKGSKGRGIGSRVWRVRRDLGRNEGGE